MYKVLIVLLLFNFHPAGSAEQQIKINVDTLSYMGCSNPSSFFGLSGFKLGAYSEGLQLTDEFQQMVEEQKEALKKVIVTNSSLVTSRGQVVIDASKVIRRGQVTINHKGNVREALTVSGQPLIGSFPSVDSSVTIEDLLEKGVLHSVGIDHPIEANLTIPGSVLRKVLSYLSLDFNITLTYNNGSSHQPLGPELNQYYGRSYQVGFDENLKYMENIIEYDLSTGKAVEKKKWACPNEARFMVLRSEEERWYDPREAAEQEAVCVEDDSVLIPFIQGKQSLERLFPEALIAVGFVHTWKQKDVKDLKPEQLVHRDLPVRNKGDDGKVVWMLEKTDIPCIANRHSDVKCYSLITSIQWKENECKTSGYYNRCPVYFSFCTAG